MAYIAVALALAGAAVATWAVLRVRSLESRIADCMRVQKEADEAYIRQLQKIDRQWTNMMQYAGEQMPGVYDES